MKSETLNEILFAELLNVSQCARDVIDARSRLTPDQKNLKIALKRLDAVYTDIGRSSVLNSSVPADQYEIVVRESESSTLPLFSPDSEHFVDTHIENNRRVLDLRGSV